MPATQPPPVAPKPGLGASRGRQIFGGLSKKRQQRVASRRHIGEHRCGKMAGQKVKDTVASGAPGHSQGTGWFGN